MPTMGCEPNENSARTLSSVTEEEPVEQPAEEEGNTSLSDEGQKPAFAEGPMDEESQLRYVRAVGYSVNPEWLATEHEAEQQNEKADVDVEMATYSQSCSQSQ